MSMDCSGCCCCCRCCCLLAERLGRKGTVLAGLSTDSTAGCRCCGHCDSGTSSGETVLATVAARHRIRPFDQLFSLQPAQCFVFLPPTRLFVSLFATGRLLTSFRLSLLLSLPREPSLFDRLLCSQSPCLLFCLRVFARNEESASADSTASRKDTRTSCDLLLEDARPLVRLHDRHTTLPLEYRSVLSQNIVPTILSRLIRRSAWDVQSGSEQRG